MAHFVDGRQMGRAVRSDPTSHHVAVRGLQLNIGALSG